MISQALQHRSGRVIALGRVTLVACFLLAAWFDPAHATESAGVVRALLASYAALSLLILLVSWNSWIWESRLAAPTHVLDIIVFTVLLDFTRGYTSPYFSFYAFLILAAAIRWSSSWALLTAVFIVALYLSASFLAVDSATQAFDTPRFVVRGANLLVLSFMIVWFGLNQARRGGTARSRLANVASLGTAPPIADALQIAADELRARRTIFVWSDTEEPWLNVWSLRDGTLDRTRLGPEEFPEIVTRGLRGRSFLFDLASGNVLDLAAGRLSRKVNAAIDRRFAQRFGLASGLAIPIAADRYQGHLFALEIPGLCADDLRLAAELREGICAALQRTELNLASQEAAEAQLRMMLARDLHDGVVQSFSGIALRLRALRNGMDPASAAYTEIRKLLQQLGEEQGELRRLIASLRNPADPAERDDAPDWLAALAARLARQWGIGCEARLDPASSACPPQLLRELEPLLREAVANAVRHGGAKQVEIVATATPTGLELVISDDGQGFPLEGEFDFASLQSGEVGPRSMVERVENLGGRLHLTTNRLSGSRITVTLPLETFAA